MAMINPPHPGQSIRKNCLEPLGLSVTDAARFLGIARHTLSRLLNGHAGISPGMAIRLAKAGWSNADFWLRRQAAWDLAQAREHEDQIKAERYRPQPASCLGVDRMRQPWVRQTWTAGTGTPQSTGSSGNTCRVAGHEYAVQ